MGQIPPPTQEILTSSKKLPEKDMERLKANYFVPASLAQYKGRWVVAPNEGTALIDWARMIIFIIGLGCVGGILMNWLSGLALLPDFKFPF